MNIQAKVALDKEKHPDRYCPVNRCLWRTVQLKTVGTEMRDGVNVKMEYESKADCPGGYCPRHQHLRKG